VIFGATVSLTVTVNEQYVVLPDSSSAAYDTVVTPTLNVLVPTTFIPYDDELPVVAPVMHHVNDMHPQLSLYVGLGTLIFLLQLLPLVFCVILAGQLNDGAWLSITFTVKQQLLVRPDASLTV
jgi:hypothetical protein